MRTTPKQIKVKSYYVEHKNGLPIDPDCISCWTDIYDESGKLIEKIWSDESPKQMWTVDQRHISTEVPIWTYEYDEKDRLVCIRGNFDPEFIEYHSYDIDKDGNDVEIISKDAEDPNEAGYDTKYEFFIRDTQGRLLAKWRLFETRDMGKANYSVLDHVECIYNENGVMTEVIEYGEHKLDEDGNIEDAKEVKRMAVSFEESENQTVLSWKNESGELELKETRVFFKDKQGKVIPKEYILEKNDICHSHIEYDYPDDDSFDHYITYEYNDLENGILRTEYKEEY